MFFHQFIAYIFHTEEGRRMRGPFIAQTLARTLTYMVVAVPLLVLLWHWHLLSTDTPGFTTALIILVVDAALGIAFIRTVYRYRHRVKIVYHIYFGDEGKKPKELPPDADLDLLLGNLGNSNDTVAGAAALDDELEEVPEGQEDPDAIEMQVTLECSRCHRQLVSPVRELAAHRQCQCGGDIIEM